MKKTWPRKSPVFTVVYIRIFYTIKKQYTQLAQLLLLKSTIIVIIIILKKISFHIYLKWDQYIFDLGFGSLEHTLDEKKIKQRKVNRTFKKIYRSISCSRHFGYNHNKNRFPIHSKIEKYLRNIFIVTANKTYSIIYDTHQNKIEKKNHY